MPSPVTSLAEFRSFVRDHPLGVVATTSAGARPEAALVSLAVAADGAMVFNSLATARKIQNLAARPDVAVVVGCVGERTVQVEGTARVESGPQRAESAAVYLARFPGSRTDPTDMAIVVIRPRWLRFYCVAGGMARSEEGRPGWLRAGDREDPTSRSD